MDKRLFSYLREVVCGQKIVLWFCDGQKFQFLSCSLSSVNLVPERFYKSNTIQLELSCSNIIF